MPADNYQQALPIQLLDAKSQYVKSPRGRHVKYNINGAATKNAKLEH